MNSRLVWCFGFWVVSFISGTSQQAGAVTVHVDSGKGLVAALSNQSIDRILVDQPVRLEADDFAPYAIRLNRNVTVTAALTGPHQLIDFNAHDVQNKIVISPGYNLSFIHLTLLDTRYGPGADVDILASSPDGILFLADVAKLQTSCPPLKQKQILAYVRDDTVPGVNDIDFPATTVWENVTYDEPILYKDFSTRMAVGENAADRGYVVHKNHSWKLCKKVADAACIAQVDAAFCVKQDQDEVYARTHPRPSNTPGQLNTAAKAGVGVGAAVVGLFLAGAALLLFAKANRKKQQQAQVPPLLPTAHKPLDGSSNGSTPPAPDCMPPSSRYSQDSSIYCTVKPVLNGLLPPSKGRSSGSLPSIMGGTLSAEQVADLQLGVMVGAGSFGRVFAGRLGSQDVAIKVVHHDNAAAQQVATEVELMMSFDHPHLVKAHHFVTWGSAGLSLHLTYPEKAGCEDSAQLRPFSSSGSLGSSGLKQPHKSNCMLETWIVCELCNAGNLQDAVTLRDQGPFWDCGTPQIGILLQTLVGVAKGMEWCHNSNVLHGDLKAANVMMCISASSNDANTDDSAMVELIPKVADFGLSRVVAEGASHHSTRTMGTITHQAPELMRSGRLSKAADVFSFGVLMWEVFAAAHPWQDHTMGEVMTAVMVEGRRLTWGPNTPKAYASLAEQCWQADPAVRPTFAQLVVQLQQLLEQHEVLQAKLDSAEERP